MHWLIIYIKLRDVNHKMFNTRGELALRVHFYKRPLTAAQNIYFAWQLLDSYKRAYADISDKSPRVTDNKLMRFKSDVIKWCYIQSLQSS